MLIDDDVIHKYYLIVTSFMNINHFFDLIYALQSALQVMFHFDFFIAFYLVFYTINLLRLVIQQ